MYLLYLFRRRIGNRQTVGVAHQSRRNGRFTQRFHGKRSPFHNAANPQVGRHFRHCIPNMFGNRIGAMGTMPRRTADFPPTLKTFYNRH